MHTLSPARGSTLAALLRQYTDQTIDYCQSVQPDVWIPKLLLIELGTSQNWTSKLALDEDDFYCPDEQLAFMFRIGLRLEIHHPYLQYTFLITETLERKSFSPIPAIAITGMDRQQHLCKNLIPINRDNEGTITPSYQLPKVSSEVVPPTNSDLLRYFWTGYHTSRLKILSQPI